MLLKEYVRLNNILRSHGQKALQIKLITSLSTIPQAIKKSKDMIIYFEVIKQQNIKGNNNLLYIHSICNFKLLQGIINNPS